MGPTKKTSRSPDQRCYLNFDHTEGISPVWLNPKRPETHFNTGPKKGGLPKRCKSSFESGTAKGEGEPRKFKELLRSSYFELSVVF